jgi:hypothetical protein
MTNILEGFTKIEVHGVSMSHNMKSLGFENFSLSHIDLFVNCSNLTTLSFTRPECDLTKLKLLKHLTKLSLLSVSFYAARELIWDIVRRLVYLEIDCIGVSCSSLQSLNISL